MAKVIIMDHPLIQHKIGMIRRIETGTKDFRQTIGEIASLICYEATRNLKLADVETLVDEVAEQAYEKPVRLLPILSGRKHRRGYKNP